jgi:glucose-6-phosphate isomerase
VLKKQKEQQENSRKPPLSPVKKEASEPKKANVFAYLDMNSDDESETEQQDQFPELVASEPKDPFEKEKKNQKKISYASMAAKTESEYKIEQIKQTNLTPTPFVEKKIKDKMKNFWPTLATGQKSPNPNKVFAGNRPTRILFAEKLDPYTLGQLLSYYEHAAAFQGFLWDINSFDQEGVQLGKVLAMQFLDLFAQKNKGGDVDSKGFPIGAAYLRHIDIHRL